MSSLRRAWFLVAIGVAGVSMSGPLITTIAVPALAVAFWRTALGAAATAPLVLVRHAGELRSRTGRQWLGAMAAGTAMALHFGLWIPSLRLTSVAASTALVATTPVWTVLAATAAGRRPGRAVLIGLVLASAGVLAATGADAGGPETGAPLGDLLALGGGAAMAGYALLGERVRAGTSTPVYTLLAYSGCAVALAVACRVAGVPLTGYPVAAWAGLAVLTLVAQLLGHSLFNAALPAVGATALAQAILLEVPGAALIAWVWLGQRPPAGVLPGGALVLAGLLLVVGRGRRLAP